MADKRVEQLETMLRAFLQPIKNQPFSLIIKALTGHEVLPFDLNDVETKTLFNSLKKAVEAAANTAKEVGIFAGRSNEAGNAVEPFVLKALEDEGLEAKKPNREKEVPNRRVIPTFKSTLAQTASATWSAKPTAPKAATRRTARSSYLPPKIPKSTHQRAI